MEARRRAWTLACCCAALAAAAACQRRSPPPASSPDALLFRIEPAPDGGGARKAWIATYEARGRTARFRVELLLKDSGSGMPFAFTEGALVREPGSDGTYLTVFLKGEAREQAASVLGDMGPQASSAVPHLTRMLEERGNAREGYAAAVALGAMGPAAESALPALRGAADDPDRTVSQAARYALGAIQPK